MLCILPREYLIHNTQSDKDKGFKLVFNPILSQNEVMQ